MRWSTLASIERPTDFALSSGRDEGADEGPRALEIRVAAATLAIPLAHVVEVASLKVLTRLPGAPEWCVGLLNLRGRVVTVVDLGRYRGESATDGPIVVVEQQGRRFGLRVSRVLGVQALAGQEAVDVVALGSDVLDDL